VRSRNLEHEEVKAQYRAVKMQPQWVVTPGKQTTTTTTVMLGVVLYGRETLGHTIREGHKLRIFESKVLKKIF